MSIYLLNFPLPPSENTRLIAIKNRMIKSKVHVRYLELCHLWARQNQKGFDEIRNQLLDRMLECHQSGRHFSIRVDCYFIFEHDRIFTDKNVLQKLDADNRIKACLDGLSSILGIDDRHFFASSCEKLTTHSKESECSILKMTQMSPRTLEDLKKQIRTEINQAF